MKKVLIIIISCLAGLLILGALSVKFLFYKIELKTLKVTNVDYENKTFDIEITKNNKILLGNHFTCEARDGEDIVISNGEGVTCSLTLSMNKNYKLVLSNRLNTTKEYDLSNYINNADYFKFNKEILYMVLEEEYEINYETVKLVNKEANLTFKSDNEEIVKVEGNKLKALSKGEANISLENTDKTLKVVVTDLLTLPVYVKKRKDVVPCNKYSEEDNYIMDELLKQRVDEAGRGTRAGAVAAARFLTLEFPYRIPYFYENGRLADSGVHIADGEGRYYHEGLYLNDKKKENISKTFAGPAIWGCPLKNYEDDPYFGYRYGKMMPNGLDCSGFVAWALKNGGLDPGDIGAGETPDAYQMTDLAGEENFVRLDMDLVNSGRIRVGDLFNYWGHIAIIIGWDGTYYYVAESLPNFQGVEVRVYDKAGAVDMFRYVVFMDEFYKEDGNYTEYWN